LELGYDRPYVAETVLTDDEAVYARVHSICDGLGPKADNAASACFLYLIEIPKTNSLYTILNPGDQKNLMTPHSIGIKQNGNTKVIELSSSTKTPLTEAERRVYFSENGAYLGSNGSEFRVDYFYQFKAPSQLKSNLLFEHSDFLHEIKSLDLNKFPDYPAFKDREDERLRRPRAMEAYLKRPRNQFSDLSESDFIKAVSEFKYNFAYDPALYFNGVLSVEIEFLKKNASDDPLALRLLTEYYYDPYNKGYKTDLGRKYLKNYKSSINLLAARTLSQTSRSIYAATTKMLLGDSLIEVLTVCRQRVSRAVSNGEPACLAMQVKTTSANGDTNYHYVVDPWPNLDPSKNPLPFGLINPVLTFKPCDNQIELAFGSHGKKLINDRYDILDLAGRYLYSYPLSTSNIVVHNYKDQVISSPRRNQTADCSDAEHSHVINLKPDYRDFN